MTRHSILSGGMAVLLAVLSLTVCISADKVYELAFRNHFRTGSVAIELRQEQIDGQGRTAPAASSIVLPGEHVSYMPVVENLRADAYVRVRINVDMDERTALPITANNVFMVSDGWVQKGDWFYNTEIMHRGDTSVVFQGIEIPDNWVADPDADYNAVPDDMNPALAAGFTISADADAIQSDNFHPDFDDEEPWGSIQTEEAKSYDGNKYSAARNLVVANEMSFSGSGGLESDTADLFRNFQLYMAGNEYTDTLKISNTANRPITVYFRTENNSTDVNNKAGLTITLGNKSIYSGDLISGELGGYRELVRIDPDSSIEMKYTVSLPDDSENYYSVLADETRWLFKVKEDNAPITGEQRQLYMWLALLSMSAAGLIGITSVRKRVIHNR